MSFGGAGGSRTRVQTILMNNTFTAINEQKLIKKCIQLYFGPVKKSRLIYPMHDYMLIELLKVYTF